MSPLGIAARALFAYLTLLLLVRASGKQSIRQGTTVQFVIAIVIGDMIDNLVWGEVECGDVRRRGRRAVRHALDN